MSLSTKIVLFTIGVVFAVGLFLGGYATHVSSQSMFVAYEKKAIDLSNTVAALIRNDLYELRVDRINLTIERLLDDPEINRISVFQPDGVFLADGQAYPGTTRLREERLEVQSAVLTGGSDLFTFEDQRIAVRPISDDAGNVLAHSVASFNRVNEHYRSRLQRYNIVLFSGTLILLGSLLAGVFARTLTKPLELLTKAIESAPDAAPVDTSEAERRSDEIGKLARTYRHTEAVLAEHHRQLMKSREELEHAKVAAESAARAKTDFLANMSHEIRTPLNGLIGLTEVLLEQDPRPDQRELLETIAASGDGLLAIVNELLDLSKMEAGRLIIRPSACDLRAIASESLRLFGPHMREQGVHATLTITADFPEVPLLLDAQRVRQVIHNLVSNAVKFTEEGEIHLNLSATPQKGNRWLVQCEVRDTGSGIDPQQLKRIFERFTQVDESSSRRHGGAGLGLAICHRLVELMDGTLEVTSAVGEGSCFVFTLPTREVTRLGTATGPPPDPAIALPRRNILVVEDNEINRRVVSLMLERLGQTVTLVEGGAEALEVIRRTAFDLILMDVQMPGMDGLEATRRIRAAETARSQPPIVALTAHAQTSDQAQCLAAGMNAFLTKPLKRNELSQILHDLPRVEVHPANPPASA